METIEYSVKLPFEEKDIDRIEYHHEDGNTYNIVHLLDGRKYKNGFLIQTTEVYGCSNYPKHKQALEKFGEFISADKIAYQETHNGEAYTIHKGDRKFQISVFSNKVDGGWASFDEIK